MEKFNSFLSGVCETWSSFNYFYKLSWISVVVFSVLMIVMFIAASRQKKLNNEYKVLLYDTLAMVFLALVGALFAYMLVCYPVWWVTTDVGDDIVGWCVLLVPFLLLIFAGVSTIKGYNKRKHWIQLHEDWEGALDNMRLQLRDKFSSVLMGYELSLESFEFYVPQEQNEMYHDGRISYHCDSYVDVLSIVNGILTVIPSKYNVVIYRGGMEILVLSREDEFYERILNDVRSLFKNKNFDGILSNVETHRIGLSMVAKYDNGKRVVFSW